MKFGKMHWKRKHSFLWQFISKNEQFPGIMIMVAKTSLRKIIPTPKFGLRSCCSWLSRVARDHQSALERSVILGNRVDMASFYWYWIWWKSPRVFQREYTIHITQHCVTLMNFFFFYFLMLLKLPFWKRQYGTPLQYSCLENPMDGGAW